MTIEQAIDKYWINHIRQLWIREVTQAIEDERIKELIKECNDLNTFLNMCPSDYPEHAAICTYDVLKST